MAFEALNKALCDVVGGHPGIVALGTFATSLDGQRWHPRPKGVLWDSRALTGAVEGVSHDGSTFGWRSLSCVAVYAGEASLAEQISALRANGGATWGGEAADVID